MVHYKLYYFTWRGAAETIRQIFAVAKQEYEDIRVSQEEWPKLRAETPFGQFPVLEEDGKKLAQSGTIARYLARKFGLAGKTAWEEAQVDALADQWKDFVNEIRPYCEVSFGHKQGDLEKLKADVYLPACKKNFSFYTAALKKNGSGYLVGNGLTWIDINVAETVNCYLENRDPDVLSDFPEMREHIKLVHSQPEIKKWRETRPVTEF